MGIKYNLTENRDKNKLHLKIRDLKSDLEPRNNCLNYVIENGGNAELIPISEFDELFRNNHFTSGPYKENFGDGYGEPYNPHRQVFGILDDERLVYSELSEMNKKKVSELTKLLEEN